MKISIPKENREGETRVPASPEVVKKFTAMGFEVTVESGAGLNSGFTDEIFKDAGAKIASDTKSTLGDGVFVYALVDFWSRYSDSTTLSFEAIANEPGGLGRVFLLDENNVAERLAALGDVTNGALQWSETAGLKQVVRNTELNFSSLDCIDRDYVGTRTRETV